MLRKSTDRKEILNGYIKAAICLAVVLAIVGIISVFGFFVIAGFGFFIGAAIIWGQAMRVFYSALGGTLLWLIWNSLLTRWIGWPAVPWSGVVAIVFVTSAIQSIFGGQPRIDIQVHSIQPRPERRARASGTRDGAVIDI